MYVMNQPKSCEDFLPLVEFSYNISYQELLKKNPFKAMYDRKCNIQIK